SFAITDANAPTANPAVAAVDDDGLPGGNPLSTIGDIDANAGDNAADTSEASFSGTLSFGFGGDGQGAPGGIDFAAMNGQTAAIGLETVTYGWNGGTNTLTATITGGVRTGTNLFTVVLDPSTGAYTVTLLDNVLHAGGPNDEAIDATAALTYRVTDADGSSATSTL